MKNKTIYTVICYAVIFFAIWGAGDIALSLMEVLSQWLEKAMLAGAKAFFGLMELALRGLGL